MTEKWRNVMKKLLILSLIAVSGSALAVNGPVVKCNKGQFKITNFECQVSCENPEPTTTYCAKYAPNRCSKNNDGSYTCRALRCPRMECDTY